MISTIPLESPHLQSLVISNTNEVRALLQLIQRDAASNESSKNGELTWQYGEILRPLSLLSLSLSNVKMSLQSFETIVRPFTNLTHLVISFNRLQGALVGVHQLTSLRLLDVSYNKLTSLGEIESLVTLETLRCHHNSIESLAPLIRLTRLRELWISHNNIAWTEFVNLLPLQALDIVVKELNPAESQPNFNSFLAAIVPCVKFIDGVMVPSSASSSSMNDAGGFFRTTNGRVMITQAKALLSPTRRKLLLVEAGQDGKEGRREMRVISEAVSNQQMDNNWNDNTNTTFQNQGPQSQSPRSDIIIDNYGNHLSPRSALLNDQADPPVALDERGKPNNRQWHGKQPDRNGKDKVRVSRFRAKKPDQSQFPKNILAPPPTLIEEYDESAASEMATSPRNFLSGQESLPAAMTNQKSKKGNKSNDIPYPPTSEYPPHPGISLEDIAASVAALPMPGMTASKGVESMIAQGRKMPLKNGGTKKKTTKNVQIASDNLGGGNQPQVSFPSGDDTESAATHNPTAENIAVSNPPPAASSRHPMAPTQASQPVKTIRFGTQSDSPVALCIQEDGGGYARWSKGGLVACTLEGGRLFCAYRGGAIACVLDTTGSGSVMDTRGKCVLILTEGGTAQVLDAKSGNSLATYVKNKESNDKNNNNNNKIQDSDSSDIKPSESAAINGIDTPSSGIQSTELETQKKNDTGNKLSLPSPPHTWVFDGLTISFNPLTWELKAKMKNDRAVCEFSSKTGCRLVEEIPLHSPRGASSTGGSKRRDGSGQGKDVPSSKSHVMRDLTAEDHINVRGGLEKIMSQLNEAISEMKDK